jgi:ribosomal-protein-serine acetyltransferase
MLQGVISDSVIIKMMEIRHSQQFFDFVDENRDHLIKWIPFVSKTLTCDDIKPYINSYLEKYKNGSGYLFGLWDSNRIIGSIVIREIDNEAKWAEIGYMIDRKYQGKGLITITCNLVINFLFKELEMEKIVICCDDQNLASKKLAEKMGFVLEGIIRNHMNVNNCISNMMYWGLLKSEYYHRAN